MVMEKSIIKIVFYYLKEYILMIKDLMGLEKNIIIQMEIYYLMVNIKMRKDGKDIQKNIIIIN